MYGIIASAHGECASGVNSGLKLVCGEMENIRIVDFLEGCSTEELDAGLNAAFSALKEYEKKIIITDLAGGTPFNRAVMLYAQDSNVRVLSGLNFPLLYLSAIFEESDDFDADIEEIIQGARDGIDCYKAAKRAEIAADDGI